MSKTKTIKMTSDYELMQRIRGSIPLRANQIHRDRREKRQRKDWKDERNWE